MRRMVGWAAVVLAGQVVAAAAQTGARDAARRPAARPTSVAPSQPEPPPRPGEVGAPRQQARQPVTPASDYIPYDRRTGGM